MSKTREIRKESAMRKIGIYYAYWTQDWEADFEPYVHKVADLGFDILEINGGILAQMPGTEKKKLKHAADSCNINLTFCTGLAAQHDVSSENESVRRAGVDFLKKQIASIREMGGGILSGIIYGAWPATLSGTSDKTPFVERSIESMREAVNYAEDNGVVLCVEVVNRFEQFIMNTCDEALAYVEDVGSDNMKILLDTFHMNIEEDTIGGAIRKAGNRLGHLHIGENNRKPPGHGHIPWGEISRALEDISYEGAIVMEPFLTPGGQVGRDIRVWRNIMPDADKDSEAKNALKYIRNIFC
jgi:D-psicose/D-tagatose/L-ribulose 3-epimerase